MGAISFDRDAMLGVLKTVASVVSGKATIPILANVLIVAEGGRATVSGTDLDLLCEASCVAVGDVAITVPAETMVAAVNGLRPGRVEMKVEGGRALMTQGRSRRTLPTLPVTDFPRLALEDDAIEAEITAGALARLIGKVAHAQHTNETTSYYLCGILLCRRGDALVAVATNGVSMARADLDIGDRALELPDSIVSTKTVNVLQKLLGRGDDVLRIEVAKGKMAATIGDVRLVAKLVDATYPNFERVIPDAVPERLTIRAEEVLRAGEAVATMISAESKGGLRLLRFDLAPGEDLQIVGRDALGTEAIEPIDGDYAGEPMAVGLNSRLLAQMARMFEPASDVVIDFRGGRLPVTFRSTAEPDLVGVIQSIAV